VLRHSRRLAILVLLAAAAPAAAEQFGQRPYRLKVQAGTMRLDFHGDDVAGCAERGVCDTYGTVTSTTRASRGGTGWLDLFDGDFSGRATGPADGKTRAVVHTPGAPDCTDSVARRAHAFTLLSERRGPVWAGYGTSLTIEGETDGTSVAWSPGEGDERIDRVFETHCAGPRLEDFGEAFAAVRLPRGVIRKRSFSIHMTGTREFSGGGFAGRLTTDLRLTLRRTQCTKRERTGCRSYDRQARG
jgi:hypothetical protein